MAGLCVSGLFLGKLAVEVVANRCVRHEAHASFGPRFAEAHGLDRARADELIEVSAPNSEQPLHVRNAHEFGLHGATFTRRDRCRRSGFRWTQWSNHVASEHPKKASAKIATRTFFVSETIPLSECYLPPSRKPRLSTNLMPASFA